MKSQMINCWNLVMDSQHNPLRHLDMASQHYFMQVLGWMWSMVFSLAFLSIYTFHYVWMAHLLIIGGICFTVAVFRNAEKEMLETAEELNRLQDGGLSRRAVDLPTFGRSSSCVWNLDREA